MCTNVHVLYYLFMQGLQQAIIAAGTVEDLIVLAKAGQPIAYEALQILCYRNAVACEQIASAGICESQGWSFLTWRFE